MLKKLRKLHHVKLYLAVLAVLVAGVLVYFLHFHRTISVIPSTNPASVQPKNSAKVSAPSETGQSSSSGGTKTPAGNSSAATSLTVPFGDFVSNHKAASGDVEYSVCNTTPGATCYIEFTQGTTIKKLDVETADNTGAASWSWTVNLGSGSWAINAVASLNGQTKSTTDSRQLVVQ